MKHIKIHPIILFYLVTNQNWLHTPKCFLKELQIQIDSNFQKHYTNFRLINTFFLLASNITDPIWKIKVLFYVVSFKWEQNCTYKCFIVTVWMCFDNKWNNRTLGCPTKFVPFTNLKYTMLIVYKVHFIPFFIHSWGKFIFKLKIDWRGL